MTAVRAVIFDLGHTLWDFAPREDSWRLNVLRMHGRLAQALGDDVPSPLGLDKALGSASERWFRESQRAETLEQPPSERLVSEALDSLGIEPPAELLRELTFILFGAEVDLPVIEPDTLATIASLDEQGLAMGCITNTTLLEAGIVDALRRLGLVRYLRSVVVSSAMGYRKPHSSLFRRALDELDTRPEESVFVGDRLFDDVSGAQGAGMRAVLIHQYRQESLDGAKLTPDAVIGRLRELPEVIEQMERSR